MSLIVQTVFANLIDWLFKPLDNLCSQLLTGAFGGLVGSMSNDEVLRIDGTFYGFDETGKMLGHSLAA